MQYTSLWINQTKCNLSWLLLVCMCMCPCMYSWSLVYFNNVTYLYMVHITSLLPYFLTIWGNSEMYATMTKNASPSGCSVKGKVMKLIFWHACAATWRSFCQRIIWTKPIATCYAWILWIIVIICRLVVHIQSSS